MTCAETEEYHFVHTFSSACYQGTHQLVEIQKNERVAYVIRKAYFALGLYFSIILKRPSGRLSGIKAFNSNTINTSSSSRTMALVSTQPLTKMSTRNLPGGKKRLVRRADNLAAICEPNV
jgi:hypothetical protein